MRRLVAILIALTTLSACSGGARVAEAPPPPRVAERPSPPPPVRPPPPPLAPEPVAVAPAVQPQAPRGTVQSRAYYAEADVSEWVLASGATVVFKPLPNSGRVWLMGTVPPLGTECRATVSSGGTAGDLAALFETSLGPRAVYVVVGDAQPGEVEQAAARLLRLPDATSECGMTGMAADAFTLPADPDADATLAVLAEVLKARTGSGLGTVGGRQMMLAGVPDAAALAVLRVTDAELAAARMSAVRRFDEVTYWSDALLALYTAPGDLRPPRDPSVVARFPARVARVSSRAVAELAARFAASPAR